MLPSRHRYTETMHRVLRVLLVWFMVIAMPVQGMAASAKVFCGPSHGRMTQAPALGASGWAAGHAMHAGHDASAHPHGGHAHAAFLAETGDAAAPAAEDGGSPSTHPGPFSCSACAACCMALALPPSFALPEPMGPVQAVSMAPVEPVATHQPDGLDRPPRSRRA